MAVIVYPNTFAPNTLASAAEVNANFNAITAQVNGNLEAANLAADAVTTVKIADANVTTAKIADSAVTNAKIATGIDAAKIGGGLVSSTEFGYLDGVTSALQAQIDAAASTGGVPTSRLVSTGTGLTGGGDLSADRTLSVAAGGIGTTQLADASVSNAKVASGLDAAKLTTGTLPIARVADGAVTPAKSSFFSSNGAAGGVYVGRVSGAGAAVRLPSGWSVSGSSGDYTITHNLGTTGFAITVTPSNGSAVAAYSTNRTTSVVEVGFATTSNVEFDFILVVY